MTTTPQNPLSEPTPDQIEQSQPADGTEEPVSPQELGPGPQELGPGPVENPRPKLKG